MQEREEAEVQNRKEGPTEPVFFSDKCSTLTVCVFSKLDLVFLYLESIQYRAFTFTLFSVLLVLWHLWPCCKREAASPMTNHFIEIGKAFVGAPLFVQTYKLRVQTPNISFSRSDTLSHYFHCHIRGSKIKFLVGFLCPKGPLVGRPSSSLLYPHGVGRGSSGLFLLKVRALKTEAKSDHPHRSHPRMTSRWGVVFTLWLRRNTTIVLIA